jgi:HK97 family phage prohead protease
MTGGTMTERNRMLQRRAAAAQANPGQVPNGAGRSHAFGAQVRATTVIWKDQERVLLEGYASVVEKKYRMWDMFGEYDEVVSQGAFDETLSKNPDVAYLVNHRGVTMARTTNGSLELKADGKGLNTSAYVNPKRTDVRDLITAIEDRDVTEMSFAFRIDDGEWSEDFTEFRINKVDLDRGDVSAVNYGASPHTSVAARQAEVMSDLEKLPEGAQREALAELQRRLTVDDVARAFEVPRELLDTPDEVRAEPEEERGAVTVDEIRARIAQDEPQGSSVKLMKIRLAMLED